MANSTTYNGKGADALAGSLDGVRALDGSGDSVEVFDDQFGIFRRVDKGDKVERFGEKGFTVVRKNDDALATKKSVASEGAQGKDDTSVAGGVLTSKNLNVQEEVKKGGPTEKDELDKAKAAETASK